MPPLASVDIITARPIGVTAFCPWPIATEIVSPGYHRSPVRCFFHSLDGTRLSCSFGRSMPLLPCSPRLTAHL